MKQKLLIIPDVHGRTFWKEALESDNYKKVIFLGDYVDPYWFEGIDNFTAIFNFKDILSQKTKDPDRIVLLLGNHDLSYYSDHFSKMGKSDRYDDENEEIYHAGSSEKDAGKKLTTIISSNNNKYRIPLKYHGINWKNSLNKTNEV